VKTTPNPASSSSYTFRGRSGYVIAPWIPGAAHELVAIRYSAWEPPWTDRDIHLHRVSEEYYFVFQGELHLWVDGSALTLQPREVCMVRPGVPHAVVGGRGPIEHFVLRVPAPDDRQAVGRVPPELAPVPDPGPREMRSDWGCRVPLTEAKYQNCWLFGVGQARFRSDHMCLAYLSFPSTESVGADSHRHRLHLHRESWEYYAVLRGTRVLQVGEELVRVNAGEILEVAPGSPHVLHSTETPLEGLTFRVPRLDDKVEC
jgi:mannose-6-phosphate isomerase-like protein (cupin superfamily)